MAHEILVSAGEQSVHPIAIKMYIVERGKLSVIKGLPSKHASKHGHSDHGHVAHDGEDDEREKNEERRKKCEEYERWVLSVL